MWVAASGTTHMQPEHPLETGPLWQSPRRSVGFEVRLSRRTNAKRRSLSLAGEIVATRIGSGTILTKRPNCRRPRSVPFVHRFTLNALVANSVNVRGGDPVRIGGIDVGQVVAVMPADPTRGSS